ncbi:hypothetical protein [Couchioplanes caeruleus]|uniref:Uncharacterized protein n=2 Tax=Couchioplanes caeruleus TaxID=56438 RepID=A0A1K0FWL7_9ACTN|nr:hypothetical protein [Couchioplanes caeruleus]OJF09466.1 hypothetical protein BG844_37285 [Couchioplanes caeruleus subsp. caeruleus]ROP31903.1 hypothetical protein EDD30_4830 [Couchioplanes caeruleus]
MRVLFLALGAGRRLAVTGESRTLTERGERPVVLVDKAQTWADEEFAAGVQVVALAGLGGRHWPLTAERLVLHRAPAALLRRVGGRRGKRLASAYDRRIGRPLHRRVFLPLYGRLWRDAADRPLAEFRRRWGRFDAIVVTDPQSFPVAQRLAGDERHRPRVAFRIDQLTTADREDKE